MENVLDIQIGTGIYSSKATEFHKGHYKYPKQPFNKIKDKYKIICPVHGEFLQAGVGHLKGGLINVPMNLAGVKETQEKNLFEKLLLNTGTSMITLKLSISILRQK